MRITLIDASSRQTLVVDKQYQYPQEFRVGNDTSINTCEGLPVLYIGISSIWERRRVWGDHRDVICLFHVVPCSCSWDVLAQLGMFCFRSNGILILFKPVGERKTTLLHRTLLYCGVLYNIFMVLGSRPDADDGPWNDEWNIYDSLWKM